MANYCIYCGKPVQEDAGFCMYCGRPVLKLPGDRPQQIRTSAAAAPQPINASVSKPEIHSFPADQSIPAPKVA